MIEWVDESINQSVHPPTHQPINHACAPSVVVVGLDAVEEDPLLLLHCSVLGVR